MNPSVSRWSDYRSIDFRYDDFNFDKNQFAIRAFILVLRCMGFIWLERWQTFYYSYCPLSAINWIKFGGWYYFCHFISSFLFVYWHCCKVRLCFEFDFCVGKTNLVFHLEFFNNKIKNCISYLVKGRNLSWFYWNIIC